jgi:breast cancer 2 susceptibility protein
MYQLKYSGSFDQLLLTPTNVSLQLKYRYDVEIERAQRSCVRKITEKDDTATCRTVVLFVSKIDCYNKEKMLLIEVCDGWYPIKALCDPDLTKLFENGKIIVGDKLAIFNAELNHSALQDGYPPLEAPPDFYFKLNINCVRKAKWHAKLGFVKPQRPLCIPLHTIRPIGNVGAINAVIERIYPILVGSKW